MTTVAKFNYVIYADDIDNRRSVTTQMTVTNNGQYTELRVYDCNEVTTNTSNVNSEKCERFLSESYGIPGKVTVTVLDTVDLDPELMEIFHDSIFNSFKIEYEYIRVYDNKDCNDIIKLSNDIIMFNRVIQELAESDSEIAMDLCGLI